MHGEDESRGDEFDVLWFGMGGGGVALLAILIMVLVVTVIVRRLW